MKKTNKRKKWLILIGEILLLLLLIIFGDFSFQAWRHHHNQENQSDPGSNISQTESTADTAQKAEDSTDPKTLVDNSNTPILMYHHIKINTDPDNKIEAGLDLPPEQFDLEMQALSTAGYQSVTLEKLFNSEQNNRVVLTFDDGYSDIYDNALPVMKKYGFSGVAFIITSYVGKDGYMNWDQIKELAAAGWQIGSHTVDHPDLTKVSEAKLTTEISDSKNTLENKLGATIDSFCYPSGKFNDSVVAAVAKAGYKYATTTQAGSSNSISSQLLLKRVRINGDQQLAGFKSRVIK